jgi:REP element-mobilizing transposase RayT
VRLLVEGMGFSPCRRTKGMRLAVPFGMRRPKRLPSDCYLSPQVCFVTFCTWQRQPLLAEPRVADMVIEELMTQSMKQSIDALVYCLMVDHVHVLLAYETEGSSARSYVDRLKQITGFAYARPKADRLWQRSYFDYTLRSDQAVEPAIAYIVNNPVRSRFVSAPCDWPFWGSSRWTREDLLESVALCGAGYRPG